MGFSNVKTVSSQNAMSVRELCQHLVRCEDENAVCDILQQQGLWDESHWHFYGGEEGNYSTIGNQASHADFALVEKLINSVDHVLIGECLEKRIDPKGSDAPGSMLQAVEKFFNIKDGRIANITPKERTKLAERIKFIATGGKQTPCYTIIDQGEGQHPHKFPDTLLSLNKSNKVDIPFVQGTFNMGSTGVLRFCGEKWMQLIVSRRNPKLLDSSQEDLWGFTVVRRESPKHNEKRSKITYLAPEGQILSFVADSIEASPSVYPKAYGDSMRYGTLIKMFNYKTTDRTNILFDLYNRISMLTPSIALPIRFYERRKGFTGHSYETTMAGLMTRLEEDRNENLEQGFPSSEVLHVDGQIFSVRIFAFKKDKKSNYSRSEGVIFSVNGQVQGHLPKTIFTRRNVNMAYLKDSILVHVDCSKLDTLSREDLFMNSRDRLTNSGLSRKIEKKLEKIINAHSGLRELREKRRNEEIADKLSNSKPLEDILNSLITKDPTLSRLFVAGSRISNPFKQQKNKQKELIKLKKFPEYFDLRKRYPRDTPKLCHINKSFRVQFRTNAENDYFTREDSPGVSKISAYDTPLPNYGFNLWNGIATLNISLPSGVKIGDIIKYDVEVSDDSQYKPFCSSFFVKVAEEQSSSKSSSIGKRKNNPGEEKGDDGAPQGLAIPNIIEVKEEDFERHGFSREDGLKVMSDGNGGFDFYINIDNKHLAHEMAQSKSTEAEIIKAQFIYGLVILGMAILREDDEDTELIKKVSRLVSPVLLPLISSLAGIRNEE